MKTPFLLAIASFIILLLPMCKPSHTYDKYIKELDSLKVVVEQAVDNFKTVDSLECYRAFLKQNTYNQFINSHVKDTVSQASAKAMLAVFATGEPMRDYLAGRPIWIADAVVCIKQLNTLSADLKNGAIETNEAVEFINEEKRSAQNVIEELKINTLLVRKHMQAYTKNISAVETVIKERNAGTLPQIITLETEH